MTLTVPGCDVLHHALGIGQPAIGNFTQGANELHPAASNKKPSEGFLLNARAR